MAFINLFGVTAVVNPRRARSTKMRRILLDGSR
jgi:hypothetical protein